MRLRPRAIIGGVALGAAVALAAAGCGKAGGGSSASSTASSSGPIKIGIIATLSVGIPGAFVNPWSVTGVQAAAAAINKQGGINGRKIQVEVCDDGGNPNRATTCARKAVTDGWVAAAGGFDPYNPALTLPILKAASIPYVGSLETNTVESQSSTSFPVDIGTPGGWIGTAAQMVDHGCKRPSFVQVIAPGNTTNALQVKGVLDRPGITYPGPITYQTGTTNFAPIIATVLSQQADCVLFIGNSDDAVKVFTAVRQAGSKATFFAPPGVLVPQVITALGKVADGIEGADGAPLPSDPSPAMAQMLQNLASYSKSAVPNEFTIDGYTSVQLIQQALTGMKDISAANLLAKLSTMTNAQVGPFPAINFTKPRSNQAYPRMFSTYVWYTVIKNGQWTGLTASQQPTDIAKYLPSS